MIAFLTILHGLVSIVLIGAVTHQGLSVWRKPAPVSSFFSRFRAVAGPGYANTVSLFYVIAFALGAYVYPYFVLDVKASFAEQGMRYTIGVFQIKEHVAVIGLFMVPAYWYFWRKVPTSESVMTRRFITTVMMVSVWWNLVVGHFLNNARGLT